MTAFTIFGKDNPGICNVCQNKGYYDLKVQPAGAEGDPRRTMLFCACHAGQQLRQIVIEFRLNDVREVVEPLLGGLREMENRWKDREKARLLLRNAVLDLEKILRSIEEEEKKGRDIPKIQ